jgi:hypothetical protein
MIWELESCRQSKERRDHNVYLLPFSKLPPYYSVNNILPNWNIKNITIQNHESLILIMEVCYSSY